MFAQCSHLFKFLRIFPRFRVLYAPRRRIEIPILCPNAVQEQPRRRMVLPECGFDTIAQCNRRVIRPHLEIIEQAQTYSSRVERKNINPTLVNSLELLSSFLPHAHPLRIPLWRLHYLHHPRHLSRIETSLSVSAFIYLEQGAFGLNQSTDLIRFKNGIQQLGLGVR